jgi:hypothetical protein
MPAAATGVPMSTTTAAIIKRYPTKLAVRCGACGRQNVVEIFLHQVQRLKCSKCGSRNVVIISRDRLEGWSRRRRGK